MPNDTTDPTVAENRAKFRDLLQEIFQFDSADLDFGIYRIMNHKRAVIRRFIDEELLGAIDTALNAGTSAEQDRTRAAVEEVAKYIREIMGPGIIDPDGNMTQFRDTPIGEKYIEAQAAAAGARTFAESEASIYNDLYTFFKRYYQDGDFVSQRRYSRQHRYAIPYNGEEVHLHWANNDQYYIKTDQHFRNYDWRTKDIAVRFRLHNADVEQNNVKGKKRFFLPQVSQIQWDAKTSTVTLPFEYRPLIEKGKNADKKSRNKNGNGNGNTQAAIIAKAVDDIRKAIEKYPDAHVALTAERRRNGGNEPVSHLEHHLHRYTARNNADFFVHKDLAGFLRRELDFYLKNEVLNLDHSPDWKAGNAEFHRMRLLREIGAQIIDFLAQIEGFQKMLWEKRKFALATNYCIALNCIPDSIYSETCTKICANDNQWAEWRTLHGIDGKERNANFLRTHSTLMLDTRHFDTEFVDCLLASFDDLDEMIDGLLVHSENWQALRLIEKKYAGKVKCIYIDPPYNTKTSGFLYRNEYKHSSWLAMMENRVDCSLDMLSEDGIFFCHIDENEYERLNLLMGRSDMLDAGTVIWDKRNPMIGGSGVANQHEYVICRMKKDMKIKFRSKNIEEMSRKSEQLIKKYKGATEEAKQDYAKWVASHSKLSGGERAYCLLDDNGRIYRPVSLIAPELRIDPKFFEPLFHPVTGKACQVPANGFSRTPETLREMLERGEIIFGADHTTQPQKKKFLSIDSKIQLSSIMHEAKRGKADIDKLGMENFPYCHPVSLYQTLISAGTDANSEIVLDCFAGSGTTGHAVINLNREDDNRRKFILVEMGEYFDTVLMPRIKKVTYTPEWRKGLPKRLATKEETERAPRIIKYTTLESYEDALDSIQFDADIKPKTTDRLGKDYLLKYMLQWETKRSATLLNTTELIHPFDYKLRVCANGNTKDREVDVAETFNWLLGLNVRTRKVYHDQKRRYLVYCGETREVSGKRVAIIWRTTHGWKEKNFIRECEFVKESGMAATADTIYVNSNSFIPDAKAIEPRFKKWMFAAVSG